MKFTPIVFVSSLSLMVAAAPLIEVSEGFDVVARSVEDEIVARGLYDDVSEFDARAFFGDEEFQQLAARAPFTKREIQELMVRSSMSTGADVVGKIEKGLSAASIATSALGGPVGLAINVAKYAAMAMEKIFQAINAAQQADAHKRGDFTKGVVDETLKAHPGWNCVVVHTSHDKKFDGKEGADWAHEHKEIKMKFPVGSTIGFEIYTFRSGTFTLKGDGGYQNWAYGGQANANGKHVTFKASTAAKGSATNAEAGFKGEKPVDKAAASKPAPKKGKKREFFEFEEREFFDDEFDYLL